MPRKLAENQAKDVAAEHKPAKGEHFWKNEEGTPAIEYGLIAALRAEALDKDDEI